MYKVAIVDDESLVRVGFQTIIDWQANGYELQGTYRNGSEAWNAFCAEGYPDILLTDIRMPEMDGLELIRRIRETDEDMIILVLSSYEEFEYTRRSIQLGVHDYIPKHLFDPEELLGTLGRLNDKRSIHAASKLTHPNKSEGLKAEKRSLMTKSRSIPGIIEPSDPVPDKDFPLLIEQAEKGALIEWIAIREVFAGQPYLESDLSALGFLLHDLMDKAEGCLPLGIDQGVFLGLITAPRSKGRTDPSSLLGMIEEWIETVRQNLAVTITTGISATGEFREAKKLRAQAERALNGVSFFKGSGMNRYRPEMSDEPYIRNKWLQWQDHAREAIQRRDAAALTEWMIQSGEDMADWCSPDEAIRLVNWALKLYQSKTMDLGLGELSSSMIPEIRLLETAGPASSWSEIVAKFGQAIEGIRQLPKGNLHSKSWLTPVLAYVDEHYAEGIRLEDAASIANLNVNYFSHRFSQDAGMTFLEYLTRVRIREAIVLIRDRQLSSEEAASRVGYPNANYFVKVFKKVTGMTLSEFRRAEQGHLKNWNGIE
ncbi:response regulator transcription factor [Cohnella thailandensis]|uniref:Response regulator n=1 Tax=Cohnella thailandensis TaxID=557557 RepID=A0A841SYE3_9BACL|nr:response regulator [Cohnella thailandensis]MBB6634617.1 response regulator [Cohnella thailandensis]MBP1972827.1 DNA-binding NarL/FixJ family response regulator/AraC-like DNA-binding protein [Cohnella thailandensis]